MMASRAFITSMSSSASLRASAGVEIVLDEGEGGLTWARAFMSGFLFDQPARLACCRIRVRKTSWEMPMPPDLAKDFEYSSVSIERHAPVPVVSPNGPSP